MKKSVIILYILSGCFINVFGQEWIWSNQLHSTGDVFPSSNISIDIITDNSNNVYHCGHYDSNPLSLGGITIPNAGNWDGFVCKFDANGNTLWLDDIGGTGRDEASALAIVGNYVFVIGNFRSNPITFDPGITLPNFSHYDVYLAKYDLNGNCIKATRIFWGTDADRAKDMYYDASLGRFVVVGHFQTDLNYFDGSIDVSVTAQSSKDIFIAQLDTAGTVTNFMSYWTNNTNTILKDIHPVQGDGYYLSGDLTGSLFFNINDSISGDLVNTDAIAIRVDNSLNKVWARRGGGTGYDHANSAISDQYGSLYLTGKVESIVQFDSTETSLSNPISGMGAGDIYLAKYNKQGTLLWFKRKGDAGEDDGYGIIQSENLIQFCGNYAGTIIFNVDTLKSSSINEHNTSFAIFDLTGKEVGAQGIQGDSTDVGRAIAFDNNKNTIIGGYSNSNPLIIGDSLFDNSNNSRNGFIALFNYPMLASFSKVENIGCTGDNNGKLIVTPYFGVGPYTYNWSHDAGLNDSTASSLSAGSYSVTITDSRDSTAFTSIDLNEPSVISIESVLSDVSCHPTNGTSNNGGIDLTVSGGTGTYTYAWEAIAGSGVNATSEDQVSLTMGEYRVTVTDDNFCTKDSTFLIAQPDEILFTPDSVKNITIPPGSNGAVYLTPGGGTPVFDYNWTGPGGFNSTNEDITGLEIGGTYTLQITDANSCIADSNFLVTSDTMLVAFISYKSDVLCKNDNSGSATVDATGSPGPFTYNWSNGAVAQTASDLVQATYTVTVTEIPAPYRSSVATVQISEPANELTSSILPTHLPCYQDNSGIADLTVEGGTLPYAFNWSNGGTTEDQLNLSAGLYSVTVTDKNGCTVLDGITLNEGPAIGISIDIDNGILCNGDLTGILTADATGGTGTFNYVWDDPGNQTAQTATNLGGGLYHVTATDLAGCSVTGSRQLIEPADIGITPNTQDISCFGADDGIIALTISGGTPTFNFLWSNGAINQNIQDLSAGIYGVTVTDINNCSDTTSITIFEPGVISYQSVSNTDVSCNGYTDGTITVSGIGGSGALEYSTDGGSSYSTSGNFTDLTAQTYTLKIRDANDCESVDSIVSVSQPEGITISSEEASNVSCNGESDGVINIVASSTIGGLTFSIDDGQNYFDNSGTFSGLSEGNYQIRIMDLNGCELPGSAITIEEPLPITIEITITEANVEMIASGGTAPYLYVLLSVSDSSSNNNGVFSDLLSGNYDGYAIDVNQCESEVSEITIGQGSTAINIYDAFSPNGDGVNDLWNIANIGLYPNCKVVIFNTWGNKVFESDGYGEPWDGKYNGKDLPSGTYYFTLDLGDGSKVLSGPVSIVR